jgi:beta-mannosidase
MSGGRELREGWELTDDPGAEGWLPAVAPGTVAAVLPDADLDGRDWWLRTRFTVEPGDGTLVLDGVATLADVYLDGEPVAHSESMFVPIRVPLDGVAPGTDHELRVCCRALAPRLAERRRPRARWRTALVAEGNLRFHRTMLLGRAPGFSPGPPVVGIYRPVRIEPVDRPPEVHLRARYLDGACMLEVGAGGRVELTGPTGRHVAELASPGPVTIAGAAAWWPHTHGDPALYDVSLDGAPVGRVGFRSIDWPPEWEADGLALRVNDVPVFCRGAVWTPRDLARPHAEPDELRCVLSTVLAGGINMLRIPGIACYESDAFYGLCDELGILVWQDFMFANLDYPDTDPGFMAAVEEEARFQLGRLAGRPSLSVVCGGSEVAQQVAMLGLDPELGRGPLYTELLPRLVADSGAGVPYVPNSPWGGEQPFRPGGVSNYYGVGAYLRPMVDARLAEVGFAAECLAFANVPDDAALETGGLARVAPHAPAWKAGVPRDAGAGWDFEDVRDHYLSALYDVDPVALRATDLPRYLELSRAVSGEVMAEVFGEWRRAGSSCGGGLVLWLQDHRPGAGWGLLDHTGRPKAAFHIISRALAPVAVWMTDEGLRGIAIHLANDRPGPLAATLRIAAYRDFEVPVAEASTDVVVPPHGGAVHDAEALLGRFVDLGWAYRFGPPGQNVVVASLTAGGELIAQAFRYPVGRPREREGATALGLEASVLPAPDGGHRLRVGARRLVHGLRIDAPGFVAGDDACSLEPGSAREISLTPSVGGDPGRTPVVTLTALNLRDRLRVGPGLS